VGEAFKGRGIAPSCPPAKRGREMIYFLGKERNISTVDEKGQESGQ